jgi:hypothetical protein
VEFFLLDGSIVDTIVFFLVCLQSVHMLLFLVGFTSD